MPKSATMASELRVAASDGNITRLRRWANDLQRKSTRLAEENDRLHRKAELASAMLEATGRITASLSFSDVIRGILDSIQSLLKVRRCCIMLVDPGLEELRVVGSRGMNQETANELRFKSGQGVAGWVWKMGKPLLVADSRRERRFLVRCGHSPAPEAIAAIPLDSGSGVVGVLSVDRPVIEGRFTPDEISYLIFLADHAAVAMKNAQLHEGISRRVSQLSTLYEVGSALVSVLNADRLLNKIVEGVTRVTGAEICSLMLLDEKTQQLTIRVAQGLPHRMMKEVRVPLGQGISGYVAKTGKPLLIEDIEKHPLFRKKSRKKYSSRSLLSVPLEFRGKVIGVLNVNNKRPAGSVFTVDDQNLLTLFASQAAVTIENANLYQNLERLATTDGLTGLTVHRQFQQLLDAEIRRARRFKRPLSVIMLDIDDFKLLNDRYGHPVGDVVLKVIAGLVRTKCARDQDVVARYGGEEFVVVALEADRRIAVRIAERLRRAIEQEPIAADRKIQLRVTASLGVASFPADADSKEPLIKAADAALYHAKRAGKNRVGYVDPQGALRLARK